MKKKKKQSSFAVECNSVRSTFCVVLRMYNCILIHICYACMAWCVRAKMIFNSVWQRGIWTVCLGVRFISWWFLLDMNKITWTENARIANVANGNVRTINWLNGIVNKVNGQCWREQKSSIRLVVRLHASLTIKNASNQLVCRCNDDAPLGSITIHLHTHTHELHQAERTKKNVLCLSVCKHNTETAHKWMISGRDSVETKKKEKIKCTVFNI